MKVLLFLAIFFKILSADAAQFVNYSYPEIYLYDNQDLDDNVSYANSPEIIADPLKLINKHIFNFNLFIDYILLKPISQSYNYVMPSNSKKIISNFVYNLGEPINFFNLIMQGKFLQARTCLGRFLTNTTLGFLGALDVATDLNIPYNSEDFGQTLASYNFYKGVYLVMPIFGPSTTRDFTGKVVDFIIDPFKYTFNKNTRYFVQGANGLTKRVEADGVINIINNSLDPYETAKQLYIQNRANQINK